MLQVWQANANTAEEEGEIRPLSKLTAGTKRRIIRRLREEKPTIRIGKGGVSEEILKEIARQLDKKEMVKIKILKSAVEDNETKKIAMQTTEQTKASLVEVRGHTFMLYKRHKK
jgi:RNA-binding protein